MITLPPRPPSSVGTESIFGDNVGEDGGASFRVNGEEDGRIGLSEGDGSRFVGFNGDGEPLLRKLPSGDGGGGGEAGGGFNEKVIGTGPPALIKLNSVLPYIVVVRICPLGA
jgi:hypothetical protein